MFNIKIVREPGGGKSLVKGVGEKGLMARFDDSEASMAQATEKLCSAIASQFRKELFIAKLQDIASDIIDAARSK